MKFRHNYQKLLLIGVICTLSTSAFAQAITASIIRKPIKETSYSGNGAASDYIHLYQRYLSGARGSRCAMYPSCSEYGLMAFEKRPFIEAMVMTADRMIRCGHDSKYYALTYKRGYPSLIDLPPFKKVPRELIYKPQSYIITEQPVCKNRPDSLKGFVCKLINQHHYELALLEIERLAYFHPQLADTSLYMQKLLCYDGLDREEEAIYDFMVYQPESHKSNSSILLQIAKMYYKIGNYKDAIAILDKITSTDRQITCQSSIYKGISLLRLGDEAKAHAQIRQTAAFIDDKNLVHNNMQIIKDLKEVPPKKSWIAGVLSIIPGAGYIYDKQPASALTALLVNGALFYATYTSIKRENYGVAAIMGTFSLTFYAGNILGAIKGTKRYNQKRINDAAMALEKSNHIY